MTRYVYRLLNVFGIEGDPFSGNPLCVFEDARGLSDRTMQALALQFNLSETTFLLPSAIGDARVRIFTPTFEMQFAGHPTLGSAHVVKTLHQTADELRLELNIGLVPVSASPARRYTLQAQSAKTRAVRASPGQLAAMLGLSERDLAPEPLWVDTGTDQLLVPLASAEAVARCQPDAREMERHASVRDGRYTVYVFADAGAEQVSARCFFKTTSHVEDPATGSACANLAGYLLARGTPTPFTRRVAQGAEVARPSQLELRVDAERRIFVSGSVHELGSGAIELA